MSGEAGRYARAVEKLWCEARARPTVLSPREWALVADWHARGIPLQLVREAVEEAVERRRRTGGPRSLGYVARALEKAWRSVLDGRLEGLDHAGPGTEDPVDHWVVRLEGERQGTELRLLLERLLAEYREGRSALEIDAELERLLPSVTPAALLTEIGNDVDRQLRDFRDRMGPDTWRATHRRAVLDRLRRILRLPTLAVGARPR